MPSDRIEELDSLRGIAALAVAFAHSSAVFAIMGNREYWATPLLDASIPVALYRAASAAFGVHIAVLLFFVLSGFVLTKSLHRKQVSWRMYPVRRVIRLMPALVVSVLTSWLVVNTLFVQPTFIHSIWFSGLFGRTFDIADVLGNVFLLNSTVNNVTWTIGAELVWSSLLPLLLIASRRVPIALITEIFALFTIIGWPTFSHYGYCFTLGAMLATYPSKRLPNWVVWGAALVVWYMPFNVSLGAYRSFILITTCGIIVYWVSETRPRALNFFWLKSLGKVSYSFYLIHPTVLYVLAACFTNMGWSSPLQMLCLFVASSLLGYLSAAALFNLVEQPSMQLSRLGALSLPSMRGSRASGEPRVK